jgi:hypothetical protein
MKIIAILFMITAMAALNTAARASAAAIDELTASQKAQLFDRQLVTVTQKVDGYAWPKIWMYILIDATPEQSAALGFDFELKPVYTKSVKRASISQIIDAATMNVDYVINVPIISDEHITLANHMSTPDQGETFLLEFHLVRADRTKTSDGTNRFEPVNGQTLFAVYSFVDPNSPFAGMARKHAIHDSQDAVVAYRDQVEHEKSVDPALLANQLQKLRSALGL